MEYKTIKELCDLVVDCPHSTPTWTEHGKIVIRNNNIKNGRIDFTSPSFTDDEHFAQRIKRAVPKAGDIVITREAPMGEVGMIPEGIECCLGQRMVLLRANERICDKYYLLYGLQSHVVQHQISWSEGTGTTVSNLRIPHLEQIRVPYVPLDQQKKISSVLYALEDKIENNRKLNDNLQQQASAIYQAWFEEFLLSGGSCPSMWKHGILADIANITSGKRPSVKFFEMTENAVIPIVGAASIMGYTSESNHTDKILVTGRVGTHGVIQRFSSPCWTSDNTLVITSDLYEYTYQLLKRIDYHSMNRGSTQPLITQSDMNKVPILIPDSETLNNFELLAGKLMEQYQSNLLESRKLAELRDTLLPKLISGEIDVSNIQL